MLESSKMYFLNNDSHYGRLNETPVDVYVDMTAYCSTWQFISESILVASRVMA